jgi:hypothetical protein
MPPLAPSQLLPLAEACLDYLDREESHLLEVQSSLTELNHALRKADLSLLELVRVRQQVLAERCEELTRQRQELIAKLADEMDLPHEGVTLSQLEASLPAPWSYRIHERRIAIQLLGSEIQKLTQRNARLARYCKSFVNRFVSSSTVGITPSVRYGPGGNPVEDHVPLYLCQG